MASRWKQSDEPEPLQRSCMRCRGWPRILTCHPVLFHLILAALYSTLFLIVLYRSSTISNRSVAPGSDVWIAPAEDSVSLEAKSLDVRINKTFNIYNGDPSPQLDDAWDLLFHRQKPCYPVRLCTSSLCPDANIRVSQAEIDQLGRSSIELRDGSGDYFGTLDVYHQLHCLKYIRQYIHQDYYKLPDTNVPNVEHVSEMQRGTILHPLGI
ncbi:hypothetical protein D0Z07_5820 [Hyphodiscus hymeniophilus]|uniref:Uncharacterized protein n=1 Tax=Hyphodiscus hymeniophilus TaxID=353542 RepID=A0A9P6VI63_9HELO|nr:hypothetical protein D0Z07_5820 [Hyphodiscus hymeniophilus]